jgi:hypothetical protein
LKLDFNSDPNFSNNVFPTHVPPKVDPIAISENFLNEILVELLCIGNPAVPDHVNYGLPFPVKELEMTSFHPKILDVILRETPLLNCKK